MLIQKGGFKLKDVTLFARYLIHSYESYSRSLFENSEMKLQKLIYLAQRQSIALTGEILFQNDIQGWKHGPVVPELRYFLENGYTPYEGEPLSETEKYIIDNVVNTYGMFEAWSLREMTHNELSWKNSRIGLNDEDSGCEVLKLEDIEKDAEKVRIFDHQYGMYLDEFEDFNEEVLR